MPTYVYGCKNCNHEFEVIQKMSDEPLKECPECKSVIRRLICPVGIVFKGSGFYVNDYAGSSSCTASSPVKTETAKPAETAATKS